MDPDYISEWPPPPATASHWDRGGEEEGEEGKVLVAQKRPRLDEGGEEQWAPLHLVECAPSIKAETLLAQWWKNRTISGHRGAAALSVGGGVSKNPNTKLFHISR